MSFESDIARFAKKTNLTIDEAVVAICSQLSKSIIERTPVDSGRAKANWIASIGTPSSSSVNSFDKGGEATISKASSVASRAPNNVFYLVNNVVYIRKLEYGGFGKGAKTTESGFSIQAPNGMVRISMQSIKAQLKRFR